jgi:hypothetical protein
MNTLRQAVVEYLALWRGLGCRWRDPTSIQTQRYSRGWKLPCISPRQVLCALGRIMRGWGCWPSQAYASVKRSRARWRMWTCVRVS